MSTLMQSCSSFSGKKSFSLDLNKEFRSSLARKDSASPLTIGSVQNGTLFCVPSSLLVLLVRVSSNRANANDAHPVVAAAEEAAGAPNTVGCLE